VAASLRAAAARISRNSVLPGFGLPRTLPD
jgi:hypothetical protein